MILCSAEHSWYLHFFSRLGAKKHAIQFRGKEGRWVKQITIFRAALIHHLATFPSAFRLKQIRTNILRRQVWWSIWQYESAIFVADLALLEGLRQ